MGLNQAQRAANYRARKKGVPEPYSSVDIKANEIALAAKELEHTENLIWAQKQDETGQFYKSECRSAIRLLAIYQGNNYLGTEDLEEVDSKTEKKKKQNIPNPSIQSVRIKAIEIEVDGAITKIDPNIREYRDLYEVNRVVSFQEWLNFRDKARKDLFWLGRLLGLDFYHNTHQIMCDMFVKKNFDGMYFPGFNRNDLHYEMLEKQQRFAANNVATRTMMLFAPRSSYKSTIDGADAVQWMLNAPDIRILIMTSVLRLSKELMGEIKSYFYLPLRGEATSFQLLFPEYILTGVDGTSLAPMECPAKNFNSKEPHLWVTSLDSSFVGSRCDIRKIDDAVEDKNSADDDLREGLKRKITATGALVESWGFTDIIGTRYFTTDWYGWRMGQVPDPEDITNSTEPFAYLSLSAWEPKPGFEVKYEQLLSTTGGIFNVTEDMVDLFFPKKLSFKILRTKLREYKERGFKNQYLNIATDPMETTDTVVHFTKDVLRSHTYGPSAAPKTGEKIVTIDWAYSEKKTSDFSVLAAHLRHTREDGTEELVVTDIDYDKWKASDLALHIVLFLRSHRPNRTFIEKALGADLLLLQLKAEATRLSCLDVLEKIKWIEPGNTRDAKANRIKTLEILLADDRLHFVSGPWIDELYRQFERFTGETKKGRKDDIPDGISMATRTLPPTMFNNIRVDPEEEQRMLEQQEKEYRKARHYEAMFGNQYSGTRLNPGQPNLPAPTWRERALGRRKDAAPVIEETTPAKPRDPRMVIFGNKGPWRL